MSYKNCSLYLCPISPHFFLTDHLSFIKKLRTIEFIAQPLEKQTAEKNSFFVGRKYLDYIAYMGCSPAIQFDSSDNNENFCHIKIQQFDSAKLISSKLQNRAPHCPHCKQLIKNWQQHLTDSQLKCDLCKTSSGLEEFNWRKNGGYARIFIEITDIFPKEALPQQTLLDKLALASDTDWQYFYSCR